MWRAIAALAGVLSGCATAPEPVHHKEPAPLCGGDLAGTEWWGQDRLQAYVVQTADQNCAAGAAARGGYGEVRVVVRRGSEGAPLIETEVDAVHSAGLTDDDRLCVRAETEHALESLGKESGPEDLWKHLGAEAIFFVGFARPAPNPEF
jgi:hypothetical protein